ncbi:hypothetical protein [Bosea sp. OAE752]
MQQAVVAVTTRVETNGARFSDLVAAGGPKADARRFRREVD